MKIYFVRHGQSEANLEKKMAGHADVLLTDKGRQQAYATAENLKKYDIDIMFVSPLKRARETAEIINSVREKEIPLITRDELIEVDYGMYEGVDKTNFDYNSFWDYSDKNNVNRFFLFAWPIIRFIYGDIMRYYQDKNILLVSSAGVAKIFEMMLGDYSLDPKDIGSYLPNNSEVIEYSTDSSEYSVYFSNDKSNKHARKFNRKLFEIITPNIIGKANDEIKRKFEGSLVTTHLSNNPKIRNRVGIICVNSEGKILIRKFSNTGEVKLSGGDIDYVAGLGKSVEHNIYDHTGYLCDYKNLKRMGNTLDIRPGDPLAEIQITEVVVVKLFQKIGEPDPPLKEITEGCSIEWLDPKDAYDQISESLKYVHECKEAEGTQYWRPIITKQTIVYRDKLILDYYMKHMSKYKM